MWNCGPNKREPPAVSRLRLPESSAVVSYSRNRLRHGWRFPAPRIAKEGVPEALASCHPSVLRAYLVTVPASTKFAGRGSGWHG